MKTLLFVLLFIFIISSSSLVISRPGENVSLDQAVEQVKRENGGRVLSATTERKTHNVRVLMPNGKVKRYRINEQDGQYIRSQR